jgi:hypothetical protein
MVDIATHQFYRRILQELSAHRFRFVVGGTYALSHHTDMQRETKDLDLFVHREDIDAILAVLARAGFHTELTYPHWLGKVHHDGRFVDVIFSSGNGLAPVDEAFFEHASPGELFDTDVLFCPVEEIVWSKAFIMERERYDGADIAHLLLVSSDRLDWERLVRRFGEHWRVLLSHLVLFGFIYPSHRTQIPSWVINDLTARLCVEAAGRESVPVCGGTLLSRAQFLTDIREWGYQDGRLRAGAMNEGEIEQWTKAFEKADAESGHGHGHGRAPLREAGTEKGR